jgi:hypothetical protein
VEHLVFVVVEVLAWVYGSGFGLLVLGVLFFSLSAMGGRDGGMGRSDVLVFTPFHELVETDCYEAAQAGTDPVYPVICTHT